MTPELSIAIVLYNSDDSVRGCLEPLAEIARSGWAEVIAVDNASPDRSVEVVRHELPLARLVQLSENRGFAAGVNAGFAQARGRYWMMLNPDVRPSASGLKELVEWMDRHGDIGVASPDIYGENGGWESPGRAPLSVLRGLLELSRLHRLLPQDLRGKILRGPYWAGGDQLSVGWVPGTAMIVRPRAADQVGRLREDLFMYGEDIEWCYRMRRAGWRVGVCSTVRFEHQTSASTRRTFGDEQRDQRVAEGIDGAARAVYGKSRARALAATTALALWCEAAGPGRDRAQRQSARNAARIWAGLARRAA